MKITLLKWDWTTEIITARKVGSLAVHPSRSFDGTYSISDPITGRRMPRKFCCVKSGVSTARKLRAVDLSMPLPNRFKTKPIVFRLLPKRWKDEMEKAMTICDAPNELEP